MQKAIFQRGTNVGVLAQELFPDGTIGTEGSPPAYKKGLKKTGELIQQGGKIIYEAAFQFNEVLSIADISFSRESSRPSISPGMNLNSQ